MIILGVGAHPDDLELGVGGTLAKNKKNGDLINLLIFSWGETGEVSAEVRRKEVEASMNILNPESVELCGFSDKDANYVKHEFVEALRKRIKQIKPDRIYVHSPHDIQLIHRVVSECTVIAGDVGQILFYENLSSTNEKFMPNAFVDITDTLDVKLRCVQAYQSQKEKVHMDASAVMSLANYRYVQAKLGKRKDGAAEAFFIQRFIL